MCISSTLIGTREENEAIIELIICLANDSNLLRSTQGKNPLLTRISADRIRSGILGNDAQILTIERD